jgi:hypothetical protein
MCFPVGAIALAYVLILAIAIAVQSPLEIRICPNPTDLFIDILAEVGYVKDAIPVVEARISQVFSQTFQQGYCELPFVRVHNKLRGERIVTTMSHLTICPML